MRHARADVLDALDDASCEIRRLPGVTEKSRRVFSRRSRAFLHVQEEPGGLHGDVRFDHDFERHRARSDDERRSFVSLVANAVADPQGARDRELDDLLESLAPRADVHRIPWYGNELTITAFGSAFIQHESLHHGQWATHAALGGFPTPSTWQLNWGL